MLILALPLLFPSQTAAPAPLDFRVEPLVELWFSVREKAAGGALVRDSAKGRAIEAMRKLDVAFGQPALWGVVEGRLSGATTCAELARDLATLPDAYQARGMRKEIDLRHYAMEIASTLRGIESDFLEKDWTRAKPSLEAQRARVAEALAGPKGVAVGEALAKALALDAPETLRVYVVRRTPPPGGFACESAGGGAVCFVSAAGVSDASLVEAVVREWIHAMEITTTDGEDVLTRLRGALRARRVPLRSRNYRDAVDALTYLCAAAAVRAHVDPEHVDEGLTGGYYARAAEVVAIERPLWERYSAGEIDAEALVNAIAEDVAGL